MEQWVEIRRLVFVEGRSRRSICGEFGLHWETVKKILEHTEPLGYRRRQPREKPKIGPFMGIIEEALRHDGGIHRKQRHTAVRITFNPVHYLALLERKPGAFDVARPLEHWQLPECFGVLRRWLENQWEAEGTSPFASML